MKVFLIKIWKRIINFFKWIFSEVKDWHNLITLIIVSAVMFIVCVIGVTTALFLTDHQFHIISAATIVLLFWAGPFTPFWPLCIVITLSIRKFIEKIWIPKHQANK